MKVLRFFASKSFFASMFSFLVIIIGGFILSGMKLQEFPDMELPMNFVTTSVSSAAASDIENGVTNRIEDELKSVGGIKYTTSESKEGRSFIRIMIDDSEDLDKVNNEIQSAVDRSGDILDGENPKVEPFTTGRFSVMSFGVYSTEATEADIQTYSRELEKKLIKLSTISSVDVNGLREREFLVELNPDKIRSYKLDFNLISDKIKKRNIESSGGLLNAEGLEKRILTYSKISNIEDLKNTIVAITNSGINIKLKDIALVTDTFEKKDSSTYIGENLGLSFDIKKASSADIRDTISDVKDLLKSEKELFNDKFKYDIGMDLSVDMAERFNIVISNGLMGLFLVICILSLSLRKSISFWVSISIPFCVLGVVALLPFFGISLDTITLASLLLVIGIIVDDSVVVAESISQYRLKGLSPLESSVEGVKDVFKPLIASLTTTCLVFVPMLFLTGGLGMFVFVVPVVVILSLLLSMIDCFILLPAHIKNIKTKEEIDNFKKIKELYVLLLKFVLNNKIKSIIASIIITAAALFTLTLLKIDFFPTDDAKYLKVRVIAPTGTAIHKVEDFNLNIIKKVKEETGQDLKSIILNNGTPKSSGTIELVNVSEREISAEEYAKKYRGLSDNGFKVVIRVDGGAGPPKGEAVDIRIISGNDEKREEAIKNVLEFLNSKDFITEIETTDDVKDHQIRVIPDYEWIEKYNYSVQELATLLRYSFDGKISTSVWLGDDEVDIRLQLDKDSKKIDNLIKTKIKMPNGEWIPVGQLITFEETTVISEIKHWNGERYTGITADIVDPEISSIEVSELLKENFKDDLYVKYEIGGQAENTAETMAELINAFGMSIIGMYFVLAILLNSLIQPILILTVLPYAFAGSISAVFLHGMDLSFFGLIGLLGMFGVVVNNSLVLINKANELKEEGYSKYNAIVLASENRLRPIILTSLTTIFCLLPLVYGVGGKDAFMSPMAMTLGYGLLLTIPIVLFIIPCYYLLVTKENNKKRA